MAFHGFLVIALFFRCCTVAVASRLRSAILGIDASHWQKCLRCWRKLQTAVSGPCATVDGSGSDATGTPTSHSSESSVSNSMHPAVSQLQKLSEDTRSKSALKRQPTDLVTFRVSAKCPGRISSFNSQVLLISQSLGVWQLNIHLITD